MTDTLTHNDAVSVLLGEMSRLKGRIHETHGHCVAAGEDLALRHRYAPMQWAGQTSPGTPARDAFDRHELLQQAVVTLWALEHEDHRLREELAGALRALVDRADALADLTGLTAHVMEHMDDRDTVARHCRKVMAVASEIAGEAEAIWNRWEQENRDPPDEPR